MLYERCCFGQVAVTTFSCLPFSLANNAIIFVHLYSIDPTSMVITITGSKYM